MPFSPQFFPNASPSNATESWFLPGSIYLFCCVALVSIVSCSPKPPADPCCTFAKLQAGVAEEGQGYLQVEGSTSAYFYVLDETGKQIGYESLNKGLALEPGHYQIKLNNFTHRVEIRDGELSKCSTGALIITGSTSDYYYVIDSLDQQLGYELLSRAMSFFPGTFKVRVNNTEVSADVKLKELTEIHAGTVLVRGSTNEYYYVLGQGNKQLNYNSLEKPLAFLPGSYQVKVNNTSMQADVVAGKVTELVTGTLRVNGLTEEYYYVTDTLGNALNYQSLNKPLAFFPGKVNIKVNNTQVQGVVAAGQMTEFTTGSVRLTGTGSGYYYVLDETGNSLNYNSINKSLSFFPAEYTIKLGANTRKAVVTAGQLTSINTFN